MAQILYLFEHKSLESLLLFTYQRDHVSFDSSPTARTTARQPDKIRLELSYAFP